MSPAFAEWRELHRLSTLASRVLAKAHIASARGQAPDADEAMVELTAALRVLADRKFRETNLTADKHA